MISIEVSGHAIKYARANLKDGLSLSRLSMSVLDGMTAVALVPDRASSERALDFKHGGLGRCDISEVAAMLGREFQRASLIVELPLWRTDDPGISDEASGVMVCGDEVYAVCSLDGSNDAIETTLRMADPSFMYRAFVLTSEMEFREGACPPDLVESKAASVDAILVGAYDGEGFVFARQRSHEGD